MHQSTIVSIALGICFLMLNQADDIKIFDIFNPAPSNQGNDLVIEEGGRNSIVKINKYNLAPLE